MNQQQSNLDDGPAWASAQGSEAVGVVIRRLCNCGRLPVTAQRVDYLKGRDALWWPELGDGWAVGRG